MSNAVQVANAVVTAVGLDPTLISDAQLDSALRRRTIKVRSDRDANYAAVLASDVIEQQAFLEELLVRESWFFRDRSPFALVDAQARQRPGVLRLLSAPCANGEEPYSMAITLLEAGLSSNAFQIDAIDLSVTGLNLARAGVYGARSLREVAPAILGKHFSAQGDDTYRISDQLKRCVAFKHSNILDVASDGSSQSYDIIFSRNVLIYMGQDARERLITGLNDLLAPDGLLFVGYAEAGLLLNRKFTSTGDPACFAFTKKVSPSMSPKSLVPRVANIKAPFVREVPVCPRPAKYALRQTLAKPSAASLGADAVRLETAVSDEHANGALDAAKQLADQGRFDEAKPLVLNILAEIPGSAEAEYLMGLIYAADGQLVESSRHFERSLYLQPDHKGSVEHLILVMDARGKVGVADRLRDKMARLDAAL